ncbi:MAG: polysaccharide pyruvyl transferase family protein [Pseudomonadota bacterium]
MIREIASQVNVIPKFFVLGWADSRQFYLVDKDVTIKSLRIRDFVNLRSGFFNAVRRCHLVVDIGAGDSFSDIYGDRRIGTQLAAKYLVLLARRPLILGPQTIGPFEKSYWRRAALLAIARAHSVVTRDNLSTHFLRDIGYRKEVVEASDLALKLPHNPPRRRTQRSIKVGLNVSGLLFNGGYTQGNMFGLRADYPTLIRALIGQFIALDGIEVHLVSHVISDQFEVEDDYRVNCSLAAEFPATVLGPKFKDPVEAKSYIAGLDFFMGSRMHACIAAFSTGVPVLPIAYSRKFAGVFGTLGYDVLADCRIEDEESILAKARQSFEARDALKQEMGSALERGLDRLAAYEEVVREALDGAKR